jgi:hypothetical protein
MVGDVAAGSEEPVDLFDLWIVDEDRQQELTEGIGEVVRTLMANSPGFVFGRVYESEGREVLLHVRTRTAADRRAMIDAAENQHAYRRLRGIARSHAGFYRLVDSIGEVTPATGP